MVLQEAGVALAVGVSVIDHPALRKIDIQRLYSLKGLKLMLHPLHASLRISCARGSSGTAQGTMSRHV